MLWNHEHLGKKYLKIQIALKIQETGIWIVKLLNILKTYLNEWRELIKVIFWLEK